MLNMMVCCLKESAMERKAYVSAILNCSFSRDLCKIFMEQGLIYKYEHSVEAAVCDFLTVYIKYNSTKPHIFTKMKIVSSPASTKYLSINAIKKVYGTAQGLVIMSPTHGIFYYSCNMRLKSGGIVLIEFRK